MTDRKSNFKESWWIRKALYVVVAVAGVALTGFGFATESQVDAWAASPLLATAVGVVASMFTHSGSDSRATDADVELASAAAHGGPAQIDYGAIVSEALSQVQNYGAHALPVAPEAEPDSAEESGSVADYYGGH